MKRAFAALRRKLEMAELEHLRAHCLELHEKIESMKEERQRMNESAEFWRDYAMDLMDEINNTTDKTVALTQTGFVVINKEAA